jgi:hypothetical protein
MRRIAVIVGATTLTLAASTASILANSGVANAAPNAQSTYKAAIAFAGTQNVHYVSKATQGGAVLSVVGNTSKTSGTQSLTVKSSTESEKLTVNLIGKTGYLRGNADALEKILGFTAKEGATYDNVWLYFPIGSASLDELVSGLRNQDVATELKLNGPYHLGGTKTINGQSAQGIIGYTTDSTGKKISTTLYVQTGSTPRPIQEVTTPSSGKTDVNGSVTFSNWGQTTHVSKPSHAVSIYTVGAAG